MYVAKVPDIVGCSTQGRTVEQVLERVKEAIQYRRVSVICLCWCFQKIHQVGSHIRYVHPDGRRTTVAVHGNEEIGAGLLSDILKFINRAY